jgi:hypothetical protein
MLTEEKTKLKPCDYLNKCRMNFGKVQNLFMIKTLKKLGIETLYRIIIKAMYDKLIA